MVTSHWNAVTSWKGHGDVTQEHRDIMEEPRCGDVTQESCDVTEGPW